MGEGGQHLRPWSAWAFGQTPVLQALRIVNQIRKSILRRPIYFIWKLTQHIKNILLISSPNQTFFMDVYFTVNLWKRPALKRDLLKNKTRKLELRIDKWDQPLKKTAIGCSTTKKNLDVYLWNLISVISLKLASLINLINEKRMLLL